MHIKVQYIISNIDHLEYTKLVMQADLETGSKCEPLLGGQFRGGKGERIKNEVSVMCWQTCAVMQCMCGRSIAHCALLSYGGAAFRHSLAMSPESCRSVSIPSVIFRCVNPISWEWESRSSRDEEEKEEEGGGECIRCNTTVLLRFNLVVW